MWGACLQAEEMAAFFDTRTVRTQGGLHAPAIISVQGRTYDVQVQPAAWLDTCSS